jgi:hypothetical protein
LEAVRLQTIPSIAPPHKAPRRTTRQFRHFAGFHIHPSITNTFTESLFIASSFPVNIQGQTDPGITENILPVLQLQVGYRKVQARTPPTLSILNKQKTMVSEACLILTAELLDYSPNLHLFS